MTYLEIALAAEQKLKEAQPGTRPKRGKRGKCAGKHGPEVLYCRLCGLGADAFRRVVPPHVFEAARLERAEYKRLRAAGVAEDAAWDAAEQVSAAFLADHEALA